MHVRQLRRMAGCVRPDAYYAYIVVRLVLACTVFVCPWDYDLVFI